MKRFMFAVIAVLFAVTVNAAPPPRPSPRSSRPSRATSPSSTTTHKDVACAKCHGEGEPKAIGKMEKDKAHALCQTCHKENKKGPTKCAECHKKA